MSTIAYQTRLWTTIPEAAARLEVTEQHVRALVREGRLIATTLGRLTMIEHESLEHYRQARGYCNTYGVRGGKAAAARIGAPRKERRHGS